MPAPSPQGSAPQNLNVANAAAAISAMLPGEPGEQQDGEMQDELTQVDSAASDESGSGDADASDEGTTEEQSEETGEDEDDEKPPAFTVKVDGKDVTVTLDELQKGYSRTQDYTRKTQQVAEARKAFESEAGAVRAEREQYAQLLGSLQAQLQQNAAPQVDMDALYNEDPIEWVKQREVMRDRQETMAAIQSEQQRLNHVKAQEQYQNMKAHLEHQESELLKVIPEWSNPDKARAEKTLIIEFGQKLGFQPDELKNIFDHRAVVALRKAALYDQMMSKRGLIKPVVNNGPKPAKPGAAGRMNNTTDITRSKQRLAKTGRVNDAASAIELLLR
tara:strand:- start:560 stop:1555 length:996 start_codon:yes stop_codon:yes gene_type:complete